MRRDSMKRALRVALAVALPLAAAIGCNAVLGATSYTCASNEPGACPDGQSCDVTTGVCVAQLTSACGICPSGEVCDDTTNTCKPGMIITDQDGSMVVVINEAGTDAPVMTTDGPVTIVDAGVDSGMDAAPPPPVGKPCTTDTDCTSGICATTALVGTLAESGGFCTSTCCTSDNCANGAACTNMGTGGSYCVPADKFPVDGGRDVPATGGQTIGAACTDNSQCKSGVCHNPSGTGGICSDTCCNDSQCNGGNCAFVESREHHFSFNCLPTTETGSQPDGSACTDEAVCSSNFCAGYANSPPDTCHSRCCTTSGCNTDGTQAIYCFNEVISSTTNEATTSNDYAGTCWARSSAASGTYSSLFNIGTACSVDTQCKTGICDTGPLGTLVCVDSCCVDTDCTGGTVCRPRTTTTAVLRCVMP